MIAFHELGAREAIAVQMAARKLREAPSEGWASSFWDAVYVAAELAERRRATGRPRTVSFDLPPFEDVDPAYVASEALLAIVGLSGLSHGGRYEPRVTRLFEDLIVLVANERDAVLARLREPNPFAEALVGGRVIERERP